MRNGMIPNKSAIKAQISTDSRTLGKRAHTRGFSFSGVDEHGQPAVVCGGRATRGATNKSREAEGGDRPRIAVGVIGGIRPYRTVRYLSVSYIFSTRKPSQHPSIASRCRLHGRLCARAGGRRAAHGHSPGEGTGRQPAASFYAPASANRHALPTVLFLLTPSQVNEGPAAPPSPASELQLDPPLGRPSAASTLLGVPPARRRRAAPIRRVAARR